MNVCNEPKNGISLKIWGAVFIDRISVTGLFLGCAGAYLLLLYGKQAAPRGCKSAMILFGISFYDWNSTWFYFGFDCIYHFFGDYVEQIKKSSMHKN